MTTNGIKEAIKSDMGWLYKAAFFTLFQIVVILAPMLVAYTSFSTSVNLKMKQTEDTLAEIKGEMKEMRKEVKNIPFPFDEAAREKLNGHETRINRLELLRVEDEKAGRLQTTDEKFKQHKDWHKE